MPKLKKKPAKTGGPSCNCFRPGVKAFNVKKAQKILKKKGA